MPRKGPIDPPVRDIDAEAIADRALGLTPEMASVVEMDLREMAKRKRLMNVGAKLNARQVLSDRRKRKFLVALAECGVVSRAAAAAGWSTSMAYSVKAADRMFSDRWADALEFATDTLEEVARTRAVDGTLKPIFQQGMLVGHVREYSDNLLITLLKANRAKFNPQQRLEVDSKGGVLVVPGMAPSEAAWEAAAGVDQADHRGNQGTDPLA